MPTPRAITDDKSGPIISFILSRLSAHRQRHHPTSPPPLIIGLSGPQGVGKTTLVSTLTHHLSAAPHNLLTLPLSIDDLYLPRTAQVALSAAHATNHLLAHRGQPGTHDVALGLAVLRGIREGRPTRVPRYDKAAFGGAGDRVPAEEWEEVQGGQESSVNVVILEGWCVGFRALGVEGVEGAWRRVREERREGSRLARCALQEVMEVDGFLRGYEGLTSMLDAMIHLDVVNLQWVYPWRIEQEAAQRAIRGSGMTDEQVIAFVDGYYPAYELYVEGLRRGVFDKDDPDKKGAQLRLVIGESREVRSVGTDMIC